MSLFVPSEVDERLARLELPFNKYGLDPYGISRDHLRIAYAAVTWMYRHYFRVRTYGIDYVPARGRAMLIGNHSGSLPVDGGMVLASLFLEHDPPRHAHGMVEKFAQLWPIVSQWFCRVGQFTGLPEHATRLLEDERMLMVFPEGVRGTGKLYSKRYSLQRFGTGFMRLALRTHSPIIPFAFIGGEEAVPAMFHLKTLAKLTGAPYWPVPPHLVPVPLPVQCDIHYGPALIFEGDGTESDEIIEDYVRTVKRAIAELIVFGTNQRGISVPVSPLETIGDVERGEEGA
ncbi:MAG: 1-acyl-sn-glycerol-3-phosphate acyltransferase [Myxococcales bacterium]|nr:1-acyl-sn-glycerol-3-phosphate acyltransferase [Myxococcales bacterium]